MVKLERISLRNDGLKKFFSPNEVRILTLLWENKQLTSGQIQKQCSDLSLACIAGTLDRLVKSNFVSRRIDENDSRVRYLYAPTCTQQELGTKISEQVVECLVDTFGPAVVTSIGRFRR
ncbi:MAG: MarR family transcriptional regulator [Halobacteriota archaeon]